MSESRSLMKMLATMPSAISQIATGVKSLLSIDVGHTKLLTDITSALHDIQTTLDRIERLVNPPEFDDKPVSVYFAVPEHFDLTTGKEVKMAFSVLNDVGTKIRLEFDNLGGGSVPDPMGTATVTLVDVGTTNVSALGTVAMDHMANGDLAVAITPAAKGVTLGDATIMFDDVANVDLKANLDITFTADTAAANAHFDTTMTETFTLP